jgi:hypothetical protein
MGAAQSRLAQIAFALCEQVGKRMEEKINALLQLLITKV